MTREIKFRAWDKEEKKMRWVDKLNVPNFDSGAIMLLKADGSVSNEWKGLGEVELMQFTGLYSKSGQPIYEGDIVKFRQTGNLYPVVFEDGSFRISGARTYGFKNLEIIGNIYENPELTK